MHVDFSELMLNPHAVVDALFANAATAPARIQPLAADDVDYFVEACRCVNFPILPTRLLCSHFRSMVVVDSLGDC